MYYAELLQITDMSDLIKLIILVFLILKIRHAGCYREHIRANAQ